eukprot:732144-Pyramimonas_sp.AAC.1
MDSCKARSLLVVMMLMLREPGVFLWPFSHAEQAGDVIEAVLGFCVPWQEVHQDFRSRLASTWSLTLEDLADLH